MNQLFNRFTDWLAHIWAGAPWFAVCLTFVAGWLAYGAANQLWSDDTWHLALNSPTTALTFLGVFALHNGQRRFERATNKRLAAIGEAVGVGDPVDDEGQQPDKENP